MIVRKNTFQFWRKDSLQNFLFREISDINAEVKKTVTKRHQNKYPHGTMKKNELLQNQIIYLKEYLFQECNSKNQLINVILENEKLKSLVDEKLPQCKVWLSTPMLRTENPKARFTVSQLVNHLLNLNIDVIDNRNIKADILVEKVYI